MKSFIAKLFQPKLLVAGILLAAISVFGFNVLTNNKAFALPQDCDSNSIIYCGFQNANEFKSKYNANATGDLPAIYEHFDLSSNEMNRFMSTYKWATAYKDGRIVLDDGRVVATNAYSIGRKSSGNPYTVNIAGKTYHWGYNKTAFAANSIRTLVMMDTSDKYMEFGVMTSCANAITGDKPKFQCDKLHKETVNDTTYKFWTDVSLKNANVKKVHYDFGDGQTKDTTNPAEKVSHTYSKAGKYHVTVKVTYTVNGVTQEETLQINCQTDVEVKEKKVVAKCDKLDSLLIEGTRKYGFVGIASVENATVKSAQFNFGDGSTAPGSVAPAVNGKVAIAATHQFASSVKEAQIELTIEFSVKDSTTTEKCSTKIKFTEETCKDNPNRPECQPKCIPKEGEDSNCKVLTKEICIPQKGEDANCKIPETGPAEIIGSAIGLSGLTGAGMYWRASRKNLRDLIKR